MIVLVAFVAASCSSNPGSERAGGSSAVLRAAAGTSGPVSRGLSATGTGSATVPADRAVVVVGLGTPGNSAVSAAGETAIVRALATLGFENDAIDVTDGTSIDGATEIRVKVRVDEVSKAGPKIVAAIRAAADDSVSRQGVLFSVSDCSAALAPAQRRAAAAAEKEAEAVAATARVRRGRLVSAADAIAGTPYASILAGNACGANGSSVAISAYGPSPMPFDSKPEVTVNAAVTLTYEIAQNPDAAGVGATGDGTATVPAGNAYVVVSPGNGIQAPFGNAPSRDHRDELIAAIAALGIRESDISVLPSSPIPDGVLVRVEVRADQLPEKGEAIQRVVQNIMGGSQSAGVLFVPKDCAGAKRKAREIAFAQADQVVGHIAAGVHVRLGDIIGVAESSSTSVLTLTSPDPCAPDIDSVSASQLVYGIQYLKRVTAPHVATINASIQVTRAVD